MGLFFWGERPSSSPQFDTIIKQREKLFTDIKALKARYTLLHYWVVRGKSSFKIEMRKVRRELQKLRAEPTPSYNYLANAGYSSYFEYDNEVLNKNEKSKMGKSFDSNSDAPTLGRLLHEALLKKHATLNTLTDCWSCSAPYRFHLLFKHRDHDYCSECLNDLLDYEEDNHES